MYRIATPNIQKKKQNKGDLFRSLGQLQENEKFIYGVAEVITL